MSSDSLRVLQYGLGPIGQEVARTVLKKEPFTLVGAVDIDPDKVGREVTELIDGDLSPTGVHVSDDAEAALANGSPDVVLHTTTSFLEGVTEQLMQCARAGAHVVSSTEELSFPYHQSSDVADQLDHVAREHGVSLVGTGVNPGYAMDTVPLMATAGCTDVWAVRAERVVDAGKRRAPLQAKVGAGLSPRAFETKKAGGTFGHIGLRESLRMVADGLGWSLDGVEEMLEPVHADAPVDTGVRQVAAGEVAGIHHTAVGQVGGESRLTLDLKMFVGADPSYDAVTVDGEPPIDLQFRGGIFGDTATVGMLANTAPLVADAAPGLHTMTDLPVPRAFATSPAASA
ncbi:dihydrodipicolinate reductase [Salinibacter altiplanensis]|uniref:NAD(P)H-dependent amine dehydrogenase family protein n=1 Tax=Salinibacter altiplanensis TaxID=1803181 RepID=UPI000C9FA32E|nr:dihydrodipicolinate reductase [Salinibacter altiplanensis]